MKCYFYSNLEFDGTTLSKPTDFVEGFIKTNEFTTFTIASPNDLRQYKYFSTVQSPNEIYNIVDVIKYGDLYVLQANYFCVAGYDEYKQIGYIDRNARYNKVSIKDIYNALGTQTKDMQKIVPGGNFASFISCLVLEYQGTSIPNVRFADSTTDVTLPSAGFIRQYKYGETQDQTYTSTTSPSTYLLIPFNADGTTFTIFGDDENNTKIATNSIKNVMSTLNKMKSDLLKSVRVTYIEHTALQQFNSIGTFINQSQYKQGGIICNAGSVVFKEGYTGSDKPSSDFCGMFWCNYNATQLASSSSTRLCLLPVTIDYSYFTYNNTSLPLKINVLGTELPVFVLNSKYITFEPHIDYVNYVVNEQGDVDKINTDITFSYSELDNYRAYKYGNMDAEFASEQAYNRKNFISNLGLDILGASTKISYNSIKSSSANRAQLANARQEINQANHNAGVDMFDDETAVDNFNIGKSQINKFALGAGLQVGGTALFSIAKQALANHMAGKQLELQKSNIAMQTYTNNVVQGVLSFNELQPIYCICLKLTSDQNGILYNYCVANNIISHLKEAEITSTNPTFLVLYRRTFNHFTPTTLNVYCITKAPASKLDTPVLKGVIA